MNFNQYIRKHSSYYFDNDIDKLDVKTNYILRFWNEKRKNFDFIKKSIPVEVSKTTAQIWKKYLNADFVIPFQRTLKTKVNNTEDYNTLVSEFCNRNSVVDNKVSNTYELDGKVFPQGMKLMKFLKYFAEKYDIMTEFEEYRLKYSQIMNDKKLKGNLVISIHPIDFATMSDNSNGWTSCMSWAHKGGYRAGTIEMLNSPYVVVAYLESDTETYEGRPSKKWRKLFIKTPEIVCGVKGYPYENAELDEIVLRELSPADFRRTEFVLDYSMDKFCNIETEIKLEFSTDYMYNDFYSLNKLTAYIGPQIEKGSTIETHYSGPLICLCCGEGFVPEVETQLLCEDCEDLPRCSECGRIMEPEEANNTFCEDCEYNMEEDDEYYE